MWREMVNLDTIYDFDYTLYRLSFDPLMRLDKTNRWIEIPVVLEGKSDVVQVQATGTTLEPSFVVRGTNNEQKQLIMAHIHDLFEWDTDLSQIKAHFRGTNLQQLFDQYPGTPIVKDFDRYYCLMKTIIHQQLNMTFAFVLSTRFVEKFGHKWHDVWFYPAAETVANASYTDLRELQFSQGKAEYVIDTSRLIADGDLDLDELTQQSDQVIEKRLRNIRGIGPWTIENWLMFGLGRKDLFPKADIGLQNAMKHYFGKEQKPTIEYMAELSKEWHPYRSYASLTLWRSIE